MSIDAAAHVPRLRPGDRLSRAEFERRYEAAGEQVRAELIEGVVHLASPVRADSHGDPHSALTALLRAFAWRTPIVRSFDAPTVRLDPDNMPEPDVVLMNRKGGTARIDADGYIQGPPELVVEISASTASIDLNAKRRVYLRNGVAEYLVWRTLDREIDWFAIEDTDYARIEPDAEGILRSRVFPGLWLNVPALLADDGPAILATLDAGLASLEHVEFVQRR